MNLGTLAIWVFKFSILFVLGTFCEEAAAIAKATSGSQAGNRAHRRLASNGDSSRSGKAQGLDQAVQTKKKRQKTEAVTLDSDLGTRRPRASRSSVGDFGASEEDVKDDHVESSRTFRRRRRDAFSTVDREDGVRDHEDEEEGEYWGSGREDHGEGEDYGGGFDPVDDVLADEADDDGDDGDSNDYDDCDNDDGEENSQWYGSGDEGSRRENRRSRGASFEGVAHPSRRRADTRRRPFEGGLPPAGREKKAGSVIKSVGSATSRSVKAVVQTLQPKSVGIGEILDTWKIEQVIGKLPRRVTRCAATVEFRRDGTVATSFEGRETVSEFTFRSPSWPRTCTIEFEARAFQGPWDEEPVWKLYKGVFSRKLLDPKVITLQGTIYDVTGKMLWKRRTKVGKFIARRRPSRASRGGDGGQGRAAITGGRGGRDRRQSKRERDD